VKGDSYVGDGPRQVVLETEPQLRQLLPIQPGTRSRSKVLGTSWFDVGEVNEKDSEGKETCWLTVGETTDSYTCHYSCNEEDEDALGIVQTMPPFCTLGTSEENGMPDALWASCPCTT